MAARKRLALQVCALAALCGCALPEGRAPVEQPGAGGAGMLRIGSTPAGARIIVDEAPTNFRTPTAFPLPAGSHRVILSLISHRNWEGRVRIEAGATTQVEALLAALGTGSVGIASEPSGAAILVDGQSTGRETPADLTGLAVGTHTIQLRHAGCEDWSQAVVVRQDRHFAFRASLTPLSRDLGTLAVQSHPTHALVALDGVATGKVTPVQIADLAEGEHTVEVALAGYRPWLGSVVVQKGQRRDLLVALRRLPAQEAGTVDIESDPPGASITLDGVPVRQKSPAHLTGLPPGTFAVELARPGAKTWRGEVTVLPGELTLLQIRLEPGEP